MSGTPVSYLSQAQAGALDEELMSEKYGFSIDQLMELAGLSCASAVEDFMKNIPNKRVLVVCGPGNNGGDGLVAARHLRHFGMEPAVHYPKQTDKDLYRRLVKQLETLDVPMLASMPKGEELVQYGVVVDAMFGFSFKGAVRAPFDTIIATLNESRVPVASVDIPSGWTVDEGNQSGAGVRPAMLISLTAPKLCAKTLPPTLPHYLGGRFVPPGVARDYGLALPPYPAAQQHVLLPAPRGG